MPTLIDMLTEPSAHVKATETRERVQLLSALLLVLVSFAALTTVLQLLYVPSFYPDIFLRVCGGIAVLGVSYVVSRTRHYVIAAFVAVSVPLVVSSVGGLLDPNDVVWWAFLALTPVLATMFFSTRVAALFAAGTMLAVTAVIFVTGARLASPSAIGPIAFHFVFNPLLIIAAAHRTRVEGRRRAELASSSAALAEARRMEAIGRLAGGVAHDFNNLLAVVVANAELMGAEGGARSAGAGSATEILAAANHASALTRQLLAFAKRQPLVPRPVDVSSVLRELQPMAQRLVGASVTIELRLSDEPAVVLVDPTQLEQVVMNLVANARAAMRSGGTLTLGARLDRTTVVLSVRDTGHGMDDATRERIFEPFFTTRADRDGTGLGLATVRSIVEQSGGRATVESQVGVGTTFYIELPVSTLPVPPAAEPTPRAGAAPQRHRVLVVDDQEQVRRAIVRALAARDFLVTAAASASEALAHEDTEWDVIVSDVNMPGMGVTEFVARLRQRMARVPVVFISGNPDEAPALERAVTLAKPFTMSELADEITALVASG